MSTRARKHELDSLSTKRREIFKEVSDTTKLSDHDCLRLLSKSNWDADEAVNCFLESDIPKDCTATDTHVPNASKPVIKQEYWFSDRHRNQAVSHQHPEPVVKQEESNPPPAPGLPFRFLRTIFRFVRAHPLLILALVIASITYIFTIPSCLTWLGMLLAWIFKHLPRKIQLVLAAMAAILLPGCVGLLKMLGGKGFNEWACKRCETGRCVLVYE